MDGTTDTLRWGVIGCGDVVARKAAGGLFAAGQTITWAMRRDEAALAAFAERFGVPRSTTDAAELLAAEDVDLVYIATPPDLHLAYARQAAAAGKGVLVEKPAGRCAAETRAIAEACAAAGVPFFASYYRRHLPRVLHLRDLVSNGAVGAPVAVHYRLHEPAVASGWRRDPARSGGGAFQDLGGHVLDQLDALFGPLVFASGDARNLRGDSDAEDHVVLHARGRAPDGSSVAITAEWHFAAAQKVDELVITGTRGHITSPGMKLGGEVRVVRNRRLADTGKGSVLTRLKKRVRNRWFGDAATTQRFERPAESHDALFRAIATALADGTAADHAAAAVRVGELLDGPVAAYYGGREPGWWDQPARWGAPRRVAARALATAPEPTDITAEVRERFARDGWAGPFRADVDGIASTFVPAKERKDLHLVDPQVFAICTHPSVTARVAALVGTRDLAIFKTRMHNKVADTERNAPKHAVVPWHQDVGDGNGGYLADGHPVETWTVWLALDDVGPESGPLSILPGTHTRLYGQFEDNFHAKLVERGDLTQEDLSRAVPLTMRRGEFVVFHSWLLHGSEPNRSSGRRAGLNIRFVRNADRQDEGYSCVDLAPADAPVGPQPPLAVAVGGDS